MLKKRIIPVLLLKEGRMVKGKQFTDFRDTGDPVSTAKVYNAQDADELVILDIEASKHRRSTIFETLEKISKECFMPLTLGGGINTIQDIRAALNAGADKVVITTSSQNYNFIAEASSVFGSQCIVCGVDVKKENNEYKVYTHSATEKTELNLEKHIEKVQNAGAGEIFLNSISNDGMMIGYDFDLIKYVQQQVSVPLIVCGGAGDFNDLDKALSIGVDAVACASLFHFGDNNPLRAKAYLKNKNHLLKRV